MINWPRVVVSGLIAGVVFVMMEMVLIVTVLGGAMWGPPRMMAAIVMGQGVLPPPATFDLAIVMVGMIVHFLLSIALAGVIVLLVRSVQPPVALAVGAGAGLAIYLINFYGLTTVFQWFAMARHWVTIYSYIVFGLVAAWYYRPIGRAAVRSESTA